MSKQLSIERESVRNATKQKEIFETSLKEYKDELEKARLSNVYLQKEVKQLAEELSARKLRERELSVEENAWLRVEKPRLENHISSLQGELEKYRSEVGRLQKVSDENSLQKINQMKEELRMREVLLLRERSEKDSVLQELSVRNNQLKEELGKAQQSEFSYRTQIERLVQSGRDAARMNEINAEKILTLEAEIRRLRQTEENLQDDRQRLIETLHSHQSKKLQYPQLIQGEANYSSIEMISTSEEQVGSITQAQKIRELTARCEELSLLLKVGCYLMNVTIRVLIS